MHASNDERNIHLVAHGMHTGFIIPAVDICAQLPQLKQRFTGALYLEFGWGDRRYYQTESSALSAKLLAVLIPWESTMQVAAVTEKPEQFYARLPLTLLQLEIDGYDRLLDFIANSFHKNDQREIVQQAYGRLGDSQFYQARGWYHLFNTCNNWVARGLREAGLELTPGLKMSASSVMKAANRVAESQATNFH